MTFWAKLAAAFKPRAPEPAAPVADAPPVAITPATLRALGAAEPDLWAAPLARAMRTRGVLANKQRAGMFLANVLHETGGLRTLSENLNYSPQGLIATWPSRFDLETATAMGRGVGKAADQRAIAEKVYGGRMGNVVPGDGYLFRGRGLIQLTGRANYERAAKALGRPIDEFLRWIMTPEGAAETAAWFWADAGCNALADTGDVRAVRRRVNGGLIGVDDVRSRYAQALQVL